MGPASSAPPHTSWGYHTPWLAHWSLKAPLILSAVAPGTPRATVQGMRHPPLPLEKHTISQTKTTQHFTPWLPHSCNTVPNQLPILSTVPTCKMGKQLCRTEEARSQARNPSRVPAPNPQARFPRDGPVRTGHAFPPSRWIGTPSSPTTSTAFWQHLF